jgi:hypothetical protein
VQDRLDLTGAEDLKGVLEDSDRFPTVDATVHSLEG